MHNIAQRTPFSHADWNIRGRTGSWRQRARQRRRRLASGFAVRQHTNTAVCCHTYSIPCHAEVKVSGGKRQADGEGEGEAGKIDDAATKQDTTEQEQMETKAGVWHRWACRSQASSRVRPASGDSTSRSLGARRDGATKSSSNHQGLKSGRQRSWASHLCSKAKQKATRQRRHMA